MTKKKLANNQYISWIVFFIAIIFIAVPWFSIQSQYLVNGNISWLLMAAERLLDGQSLSQHIYETNPPLSILIYIPHVLFSKALNLPPPVGSFYLTSIFVIISTLATYSIIKNFTFLNNTEKKSFILGYIISITLITTLFFSDREHFIIMALIPFVLCQYALTHRINIPKALLITVMIIGAIAILIKPHYGLIPTVFLIDRMIKQKRFNIFFDIDFIALSSITLLYIGIIFAFFPDYIQIIFPDVLNLYMANKQPNIALKSIQLHLFLNVILLFTELFREDLSKEKKRFLLFLYSCAALCFIPYFVQMKGFYNHIIPIYAFFICAITLSITFRAEKWFKNYKILHFIIPFIVILLISAIISPLNKDFPKYSDIPNLPVGKFLEKECPKPCTFFVFHGDIEIFNPTAVYMGYTHASRFPSLWFLPRILGELTIDNQNNKYKTLKDKYTRYIIEDIEHYKPSIILIAKDIPIGNIKAFNFIEFFGENKRLKDILTNEYSQESIFKFDRKEYFKGTTLDETYILKYYIYKRKPNI